MARSLAIPALLAATLLAGSLLGGAARADDGCGAPMTDWQPRAAVADMAASRGWQVRRIRVDDGCYQILGQDAAGRSIEVTLDPATLAVIEIELDDDDGDDGDGGGHGEGDQPAGTKPPGGAPRPGGGKTPD
ncbi:MAG: PepSY domain-containing protein [Mangrovicoccus sp.]|nr:PepSY domain-containing protein [Mangrovicoccus sp.]